MSHDILSPDEIAALVAAAREGGVPERQPEKPRRSRRVRDLDFTRPAKLAQDQQRRLERAHESFCRSASTRLSAELRAPLEFELINIDQLTWAGALGEVPHQSIFGVVSTDPADTRVLLAYEQNVVVWMIERLLGGSGAETPLRRGLTEIELTLTRRAFGAILEQLSLVWQELFGLSLSLVDLETQIANVQLVPPSEPTVVLTMEARSGTSSSTISLLIPYRSIEGVADRLTGQYGIASHPAGPADAGLAQMVRSTLASVEVELRAEVAAVELTLAEVVALRPGDVVRLGVPATAGVTLCAGAVPLHRARPGRSGRRRGVEIVERLEELG